MNIKNKNLIYSLIFILLIISFISYIIMLYGMSGIPESILNSRKFRDYYQKQNIIYYSKEDSLNIILKVFSTHSIRKDTIKQFSENFYKKYLLNYPYPSELEYKNKIIMTLYFENSSEVIDTVFIYKLK